MVCRPRRHRDEPRSCHAPPPPRLSHQLWAVVAAPSGVGLVRKPTRGIWWGILSVSQLPRPWRAVRAEGSAPRGSSPPVVQCPPFPGLRPDRDPARRPDAGLLEIHQDRRPSRTASSLEPGSVQHVGLIAVRQTTSQDPRANSAPRRAGRALPVRTAHFHQRPGGPGLAQFRRQRNATQSSPGGLCVNFGAMEMPLHQTVVPKDEPPLRRVDG
jgi:hypothetical protein